MLSVENLSFSYSPDVLVLKNVSFEMMKQEKICILGESGSGKSTLLKLLYEELQPQKGSISFDGKPLKGRNYKLIPGNENIKYLPQEFELEPYISIKEIVGKHLSNIDLNSKKERIEEVLHSVGLNAFADKKPNELSGGQKQRVAIARAVANKPKLLLLDEPFSQLDASLHIEIREQLFQFLDKFGIAVLYTSHRAEDALGYSDKIILMKDGEITQQDYAHLVYNNPENTYVAKLFGQVNILDSEQAQTLEIARNYFKEKVVIYPEEIKIHPKGKLQGRVKKVRFLGKFYELQISHKGIPLKVYHYKSFLPDTLVNFEIKKLRWVKN